MPGIPVVGTLMTMVFGTRNERFVKRHLSRVEQITSHSAGLTTLTDAQLRAKTDQFRQRFAAGESENDMLTEIFAVAREVMDRAVGIRNIFDPERHFDPSLLPDDARALYDEVKATIDATPDAEPTGDLIGNVEPVPAWKLIDIPVPLYEAIRELYPDSKPPFRARPFDVQLIGGMVLAEHKYSSTRSAMRGKDVYFGAIAEMKTGEGKTIVAPLACYLHGIAGRQTHVVTVNSYLVRRDRYWTFPFFYHLGLTVGYIAPMHELPEELKKVAYHCDVVYGTTSEFGFDYLRDNMKLRLEDQVQRKREFAIVDEVDSILIDEARTPLIISGPAHDDSPRYALADQLARHLVDRQRPWAQADKDVENCKLRIKGLQGDIRNARDKNTIPEMKQQVTKLQADLPRLEDARDQHVKYYATEMDKKSVQLEHEGISEAQKMADIGSFYVGDNIDMPHLLEQALRAHTVYECDKDYVVKDGQVIIVDAFTGRLMIGRQWSDGLHQAIEAKEGVEVKPETQTMATITIQNFYKLYERLSGMTGTADTEAQEFHDIYNMDVVVIPTNVPCVRDDRQDRVYLTRKDKWNAIIEEIKNYHDAGRPVLVGTTSVENSEMLSQRLTKKYGIQHEVLNAKQHEREAQMILHAGELGAVMIATNMAGRGTDIVLHKVSREDLIAHWKRRAVCPKTVEPSMSDEQIRDAVFAHLAEKQMGMKRSEVESLSPAQIRMKLFRHWAEMYSYSDDKSLDKMDEAQLCEAIDESGCFQLHRMTVWESTEQMGGLHVVGTERHESRRIDNQLRGRSGRQGDNGSSRFFISLEDDLMTMFAGETTQRVLARLGMKEGDAIEHPMLSKAVERAQRKVEERNFEIRKAILDYDEVMDHQRGDFYGTRQRILEGLGLRDIVMTYIEDAVNDAAEKYLSDEYPSLCIAEWVRNRLEASVEPERCRARDKEELINKIKTAALEDIRAGVEVTLGEFMNDEFDPVDWDMKGLVGWGHSRFGLDLKPSELRQMKARQIEDILVSSARDRISQAPFDELDKYLDENHGVRELASWAGGKLGAPINPDELAELEQSEAVAFLMTKADEVYRKREVRYPVDYILELTNAVMAQNPQAALQQLAGWARFKFGLEWEPMTLLQRTPQQWGEQLMQAAREWIEGDKLDQTVQEAMQRSPEDEQLEAWLDERYRTQLTDADRGLQGEARAAMIRDKIMNILRAELIHFERLIMLQVLDQAWKDHLYFMDQLRNSIGFRSFAQKDPRIEYRREGREMYDRMKEAVRDRITDLIFKARLSPNYQPRSHYGPTRAMPRGEQGTGVRAAGGAGAGPAQASRQQEPQPVGAAAGAGGSAAGQESASLAETMSRAAPDDDGPSRADERAALLRQARKDKMKKKQRKGR